MIKRLQTIVSKLLERHNVPGITIRFISNTEISLFNNFGYANKEENHPITDDTVFQIASIYTYLTVRGL